MVRKRILLALKMALAMAAGIALSVSSPEARTEKSVSQDFTTTENRQSMVPRIRMKKGIA